MLFPSLGSGKEVIDAINGKVYRFSAAGGSGFGCQGIEVLWAEIAYEASHGGTANRRISNKKFRMMKCGIAALSLF
jgi:hypothetical protein